MKCDLHVHTLHSGPCFIPVLNRICRESYNDPQAVYQSLKRRGMDLVTVTDHDSIDAAESLRHYPDFFLSEEVTVEMPSGSEMHVGVYDINERQHIEIQRRRQDLPSLIAYFREQQLVFQRQSCLFRVDWPAHNRGFRGPPSLPCPRNLERMHVGMRQSSRGGSRVATG